MEYLEYLNLPNCTVGDHVHRHLLPRTVDVAAADDKQLVADDVVAVPLTNLMHTTSLNSIVVVVQHLPLLLPDAVAVAVADDVRALATFECIRRLAFPSIAAAMLANGLHTWPVPEFSAQ